ncbi:MAG: hypothetical protein ABSA67_01555 [Candidatus Brocadiia bacterium]
MKRRRREFFEVFRRVPEQKEPTTWWRKNPEAASADAPAAAVPAGVKPLSGRETAAPSNKVVLTLSRELLVVMAVAVVLALAGAFVWGHSLGRSGPASAASMASVASSDSIQPPDTAKTPALAIPASNAPALPYYTLRLMTSSIDRQNAERITADLCAMGYDAFPLPLSASSWSVNIGRFPNYQSKDAEAFKKKVSPLTYRNQRFLCSWEKVIK